MKRTYLGWLALFLFLTPLVIVLLVIGKSPLPPSGPMGARRVATPVERASIIASSSDWLAREAGGRSIQFYDYTWQGGGSSPGTIVSGTALYSGFKGVIAVGYWPFLLSYGGSISENPGGGYRVQTRIDGLATAVRSPDSLAPAERQRILGMVEPLLASSGVTGVYGAGQVTAWTTIGQAPDGALVAWAPLPASKLGARPGMLAISVSRALTPATATVDTASDY